ncbi:hypothetical protein NQ318_007671 [Aromia moschata]|uniref:DNA-directed DNA polymerase n=1 Tax=Aromia moschata TaxID=1265417 RepID=A0AAV8XK37_9CUCU|nr:hypothetical protein NQ318_007671 [Aromia moschata]
MSSYNTKEPSKYLMYFDVNNVYGWAMSQALQWIENFEKMFLLYLTMQMRKDEYSGVPITHFIGLRSKMYSIQIEGKISIKKSKRVKSNVNNIEIYRTRHCMKSILHDIYSIKQTKIALSHFDDKRCLLKDSTDTLPWGREGRIFPKIEDKHKKIALLYNNNFVIDLDKRSRAAAAAASPPLIIAKASKFSTGNETFCLRTRILVNIIKQYTMPRVLPLPKTGGILPLLPIFAGLSALGTLTGGSAPVAKTVLDAKAKGKRLEETQRHNSKMEAIALGKQGSGLYLKPYKKGH